LKSDNIFIDANKRVILGDFCRSRI